VLLQLGQLLGYLRHAEELGQGSAVLGSEAHQIVRRVGVVAFEQHELAHARTVMDDGHPVPVERDELVPDADPGQRDLGHDRHRGFLAARDRSELVQLFPELRHVIGLPPPFSHEHQQAARPRAGEPDDDVEDAADLEDAEGHHGIPDGDERLPDVLDPLLGVVRAGDRSRVSIAPPSGRQPAKQLIEELHGATGGGFLGSVGQAQHLLASPDDGDASALAQGLELSNRLVSIDGGPGERERVLSDGIGSGHDRSPLWSVPRRRSSASASVSTHRRRCARSGGSEQGWT